MTPRQHDILAFIAAYHGEHGMSPTLKEIAAGLGISKVTVHEHVRHLTRNGHLAVTPLVSRGIRLLDTPQERLRKWAMEAVLLVADAPMQIRGRKILDELAGGRP